MLNPNYETLEQIMRLDLDAAAATLEWRTAQKQIEELSKKSKENEEIIAKARADINFIEGEMRRQYKRMDDLDARKTERSTKLFGAKNDDEHRIFKREVDNLERELRDASKRVEEAEARIEQLKVILFSSEKDLANSISATVEERKKAEEAEQKSSARLNEINGVRENYIKQLSDDRLVQHYQRVAKVTRNPNGAITRLVGNACGNCHMTLSPQIFNRIARGQDIEFCPTCTHILLPQ